MLHRSFKPAKCKTSCKLATSRLKLMKNKKGVQLNQMKRDLAHLLESGQDQTARIRVEHVIREEKTIAAYELVEIFCELIVARMPIIESQKNCPIDLKEAVTSVIFASPRCSDIPELLDIKKYLTAKYGKEFASAALELRPDCGVSRMLIEKLSSVAPDGPTKIKVLKAIAEEHNIQWEPKAFGEKDAMPPDDLLNGPTTFEKASTMNVEPPKFQAPPSQEQKHQEPTNYYEQNKRFSMGSQDSASKDTAGNQSSSGTSQSDVRPDIRLESRNSGTSERTEVRQSFQGNSNSRPNWNMGFKDATSAAQAAAESAELASMAARAAAELSSQGRITTQYSSEFHKSFTRDSRDEKYERHANESPLNHSFHDRIPNFRPENHVASNLSVEKAAVNHIFDDRNHNIKRNNSTESRKSSKDGSGVERNPKLQNERVEKQEHHNNLERTAEMSTKNTNTGQGYYRKSSFEDEGTIYSEMSIKNPNMEPEVKPLTDSWQDSFEPENLNPLGGERFEKQLSSDSFPSNLRNRSNSKVDYIDDPFVIDQESNHIDAVKSSNDDDDDDDDNETTVVFDEYKSEESRRIFDVEPTDDEVDSTKSYSPSPDKKASMEKSNSDDFGTVKFDYSAGPKFDSEDEFEESSRIPAEKTSSSPSERKPRFDFDDVRGELSVLEEPNYSFSRENSSSGSESGSGLKFGTLTGGFRNKGYKLPPYKKSVEGPAPIDLTADVTTVRSSFKSTETRNSDEKLSSTVATAVSVSDSDSDEDDSRQEFQQQKPRVTSFDDDVDSDEDLHVKIPVNRSRFGSGLSRRTKSTSTAPSSSGSRVRTGAESQSQSQTLTEPRSQNHMESREDPKQSTEPKPAEARYQTHRSNQLEKHAASKPFTEPKARTQIAGASSRSRVQLGGESQTLTEPRSQARMDNRADPKAAEAWNQTHLGSEKHAASKPVTEPKVRSSEAAESNPNRTEKQTAVKSTRESVRSSESEKKSSLNREDSGGKNGGASHVHPKLPDYDNVFAHFQALRENRK